MKYKKITYKNKKLMRINAKKAHYDENFKNGLPF